MPLRTASISKIPPVNSQAGSIGSPGDTNR